VLKRQPCFVFADPQAHVTQGSGSSRQCTGTKQPARAGTALLDQSVVSLLPHSIDTLSGLKPGATTGRFDDHFDPEIQDGRCCERSQLGPGTRVSSASIRSWTTVVARPLGLQSARRIEGGPDLSVSSSASLCRSRPRR